jgi:lipopolysaccharide/colanic/teichoic acid biosynthesis glycosyltransferase
VLKRTFDLVAATLGLIILSPFLLAVAASVKVSSPGPVFFRQERIGRNFAPFRIFKFRTMEVCDTPESLITIKGDPRVTPFGRFLRETKLDELPQLINVLKGEMSLVGPRPEVPEYVRQFRADYEEILRVRPGMTMPV